ncbi:hypothetical protein F5X96DRAFT_661109 [Biscogniauxia mediterranea]|nr:hypothetical protein F5X96DRAFT_661109 [Biscogniauxia mediterranea]
MLVVRDCKNSESTNLGCSLSRFFFCLWLSIPLDLILFPFFLIKKPSKKKRKRDLSRKKTTFNIFGGSGDMVIINTLRIVIAPLTNVMISWHT